MFIPIDRRRSADNRLMTVFYERDTESGEYALLDRERRKVRSLFTRRKALAGVALQKMQPVIIPAALKKRGVPVTYIKG